MGEYTGVFSQMAEWKGIHVVLHSRNLWKALKAVWHPNLQGAALRSVLLKMLLNPVYIPLPVNWLSILVAKLAPEAETDTGSKKVKPNNWNHFKHFFLYELQEVGIVTTLCCRKLQWSSRTHKVLILVNIWAIKIQHWEELESLICH